MKKILLVFIFCTAAYFTFAQTQKSDKEIKKQQRRERINELAKREEEGALVFSHQNAYAFKFNTDGWSFFYEHGKYKTITKTNNFWFEFGERKDRKEEKINGGQDIGGGYIVAANPYIYGKINNFYFLKAGLGQQFLIGGKGSKNGVAVSAIYGGGFSLGILKPYFLSVQDSTGQDVDIRYDSSTANLFLSNDLTIVHGSSGFTKGIGDSKLVPGVFARAALRFDYGRYNDLLSAIEVGVNAEYYTKVMPIMALNKEKHFFFNAYIAIMFGGRK